MVAPRPVGGVDYPRTWAEFAAWFPDDAACVAYLERLRWADEFVCPGCGSTRSWPASRGLGARVGAGCAKRVSVTAGTVFAGTRSPLTQWFATAWHACSTENGASALGLQKLLGLGSYETAWVWLHKLRRAMVIPGRDLLHGEVEVDETYVGGEEPGRRGGRARGKKVLVAIAVEGRGRGSGRVRLARIPDLSRTSLHGFSKTHIQPGAVLLTDAWRVVTLWPHQGGHLRAAVCHEFGRPLVIEELELKPPDAGEVALRVAACGVCHSDVSFIEGAWGGYLPAVFGHEVAGVVDAVGSGVDGLRQGERALVTLVRMCGRCFFCLHGEPTQCEGTFPIDDPGPLRRRDATVKQGLHVGGFAARVTVDASQVISLPDEVPLDVACLVSCAVATGYGAVNRTARVEAGASVAVIGAGGVGLSVVQSAAAGGADPLIAIDISESRLEAAARMGAGHAVNGRRSDAAEAVRALTGGHGADFVFVAAGAAAAAAQGLQIVRRGGTVVMVGMPPTGASLSIDPGDVADRGLRLLGCKLGSIQPRVDLPEIIDRYRAGDLKLDTLVTGRFPLDGINEAIELTRRGVGLRNVIVP